MDVVPIEIRVRRVGRGAVFYEKDICPERTVVLNRLEEKIRYTWMVISVNKECTHMWQRYVQVDDTVVVPVTVSDVFPDKIRQVFVGVFLPPPGPLPREYVAVWGRGKVDVHAEPCPKPQHRLKLLRRCIKRIRDYGLSL